MNDAGTRISIVLSHTGDDKLLSRCLASIVNQTITPVQILLVTDRPGTGQDIPVRGGVKFDVVECEQTPTWLAWGKSRAIEMCEGDLIYFMVTNHELGQNCLYELSKRICVIKGPAVAYSSFAFANGALSGMKWGFEFNNYHILNRHLVGEGYLVGKCSFQGNAFPFNENIINGAEDWDLHIRLSKAGFQFLFCPDVQYLYSRHKSTVFPPAQDWYRQAADMIIKHNPDVYSYRNLSTTKLAYAPGLRVICDNSNRHLLIRFMKEQSFIDWSMEGVACSAPYRMEMEECSLLDQLPHEAVESAVLYLETASGFSICSITYAGKAVLRVKRVINGKNLYQYGDQKAEIDLAYDTKPLPVQGISTDRGRLPQISPAKSGMDLLRGRFSKYSGRVLGNRISNYLIRIYDMLHEYNHSMEFHALRTRLDSTSLLGVQKIFDHIVYTLCLSPLPVIKNGTDWMNYYSGTLQNPCLLVEKEAETRINLMMVTSRLEYGGVENILVNLVAGLDKARFNIILLTTSGSTHPWAGLARKAGARVYHIDRMVPEHAMPELIAKLTRIKKINCVFIMHSLAAYYAAEHIKKNNPAVQIIDRNEVREGSSDFPHCSIQIGRSFLDCRTVGHYRLAEYMTEISRNPVEDYKVIYYGISMDITRTDDASLRNLCGAGMDDPVVLFVGRLTPQKRPEIFVQIAKAVIMLTGASSLHFALVGDGKLYDTTCRLIVENNLQHNVHLLGARLDARDLLAQATLLLMPSEYEGLALVSYEAMALGVPQIFADVNGQAELISDDTGILIRNGKGEIDRYAEACIALLENGDRRKTMGSAGRARISKLFNHEHFLNQYIDLFSHNADFHA